MPHEVADRRAGAAVEVRFALILFAENRMAQRLRRPAPAPSYAQAEGNEHGETGGQSLLPYSMSTPSFLTGPFGCFLLHIDFLTFDPVTASARSRNRCNQYCNQ